MNICETQTSVNDKSDSYSHLQLLQTQDLDAVLLCAGHQVAVELLDDNNALHRSCFSADTIQNHPGLFRDITDHR